MLYINFPYPEVVEGSGFTATAYSRDGTAANTPTTAQYRIDCLTSGQIIKNWTALTPASAMNITITGSDNALKDQSNDYEMRQVTVEEDSGLDTQTRESGIYRVKNLGGF